MKKTLLFTGLALFFAAFTSTLSAQIVFLVEEPVSMEGSYGFSTTNGWGADMDTVAVTNYPVMARDNTAPDSLACEALVNSAEIDGKIAVLYRGDCEFGVKALNCQDAGAVAVIIINNVPGDPIALGAGAVGAQVTIPVIMISDLDGALLRPFVDDSTLIVFIGNKTGLYANDLGYLKRDAVSALSYATPHRMALDSNDFKVPVGTWVHNYGYEMQTNVELTAIIDLDGTEVYNESGSVDSIAPGDSMFFALPVHGNDDYQAGVYTLSYTTSSDSLESFPNDNELGAEWWINNSTYSKSRVDPVTGDPVGGGGLRPANGTEYRWCTMMRSNNASSMQVNGVSFATTMSAGFDLTGEAVQVEFIEWNDPFDANTQTLTFDDLLVVADVFYDYTADLQNEFVTVDFDQPIQLVDDQKYLTCLTVYVDDHFIITDGGLDYTGSDNAYPLDVFFPLEDIDGSAWFGGGFGADNVPAIITNMSEYNVGVEEIEEESITAFPNPTVDFINVPMGNLTKAPVSLQIFDASGKMIQSGGVNLNGTTLVVDATDFASGVHSFNLTFEDGTTNSFRVSVIK